MAESTNLDEILARLERLEAERDIVHALNRYGHTLDYGDKAGWVDCFTPDGAYELRWSDPARFSLDTFPEATLTARGTRFTGAAALRAFVDKHSHAPNAWHKHVMVEPQIAIAADCRSASVVCYGMRVDSIDGERIITGFCRYLDQLVRGHDGRWRFSERVCEIESLR